MMKLNTPHVTPQQLAEMAMAAVDSYEFSCDWGKCQESASDYCLEGFGFLPRLSCCLAAVNVAKAVWECRVSEAKKAPHFSLN